jgi:DNA-binding MarR family transcriptional regulator
LKYWVSWRKWHFHQQWSKNWRDDEIEMLRWRPHIFLVPNDYTTKQYLVIRPGDLSYWVMDDPLPLPSLLSQLLVAFIIEFDNEFEHQIPHRTTNHGSTAGSRSAPWLVSMVMWLKFMRFVPEDGVPVEELQRSARLNDKEMRVWLTRMSKWWGYVVLEPGARAKPSKLPASDKIVRPSAGGRKALDTWRPLTGIIEKRWQDRFGKENIDRLRESMQRLADNLDCDLPDCLPVLGYRLFSEVSDQERCASTGADRCSSSECTLPMLLSKVLLAFTIEFERESKVSLAICANLLRFAGQEGVRVRDLPRLSGVSKEAIALALGRLDESGFAVVRPESSGSRVKILLLTPKGRRAQNKYRQLVWDIERRWYTSFGKDSITFLRKSLERIAGDRTGRLSTLFRGLEPYSSGWRASVPRPEVLPHYPMVLHRGGFPDGS